MRLLAPAGFLEPLCSRHWRKVMMHDTSTMKTGPQLAFFRHQRGADDHRKEPSIAMLSLSWRGSAQTQTAHGASVRLIPPPWRQGDSRAPVRSSHQPRGGSGFAQCARSWPVLTGRMPRHRSVGVANGSRWQQQLAVPSQAKRAWPAFACTLAPCLCGVGTVGAG